MHNKFTGAAGITRGALKMRVGRAERAIDLELDDLLILTLTLWKISTDYVTSNDYSANNSPDIPQAMLKCQLLTEAIGVKWVYFH